MGAKGVTFEERQAVRAKQTAENRQAFFAKEIRRAANGRQRLQQACQYVKAVGDDLDDAGRTELGREIAAVAERWNAA